MSIRKDGAIGRQLRTLFRVGVAGEASDGQLLERFAIGDGEAAELAFAILVERHGPMVARVCRAVLRNEHDAQDASQAAFLVLAAKARSLRVQDSIGPWLHSVAYRVSCRARTAADRRRRHERAAAERAPMRGPADRDREEIEAALHEEIARLPDRFRAPIVLCDLEGCSAEQAARHLACPVGTVKSRLSRGRDRLRERLTRRGLGLAALLGGPPSAIPRPTAVLLPDPGAFASAASRLVAGTLAPGGCVSGSAHQLSEEILRMMFLAKLKAAMVVLVASSALAFGAFAISAPQPNDAPRDEATVRERRHRNFERARREEAERQRLLGTWVRTSREIDGRPPNFSDASRSDVSLSRTFRDDFRVVVDVRDESNPDPDRRQAKNVLSYSINPGKSPKEVSIYGDGLLWQMIYELEGDTLRLAYYGRSEVDRPGGFTQEGGGSPYYPLIVETLERQAEPVEP